VRSTSQSFLRFWLSEECRESFLNQIDKKTLPDFRLVCHDFGARATPVLFKEISVTFKSSTFTKPGRMVTLKRIGPHVRTMGFRMPHTAETFLPPLLDPFSGEQRNFTYVPQVDRPASSGKSKEPKYGTQEITELLIQQYPPLFHAATNIPAFIRAFSLVPNLSALKISCPGQDGPQRYRRSTVDYALISLRIAIERAPLVCLETLVLDAIHPAALFYLQPVCGIGSSPNSNRRWAQIKDLEVNMPSFPFNDPNRTEHLRILNSYLRAFSANLVNLCFRWVGEPKGPSPLSLDREPVLHTTPWPGTPEKDVQQSRSPRAIKFAKLRFMVLENAIMDSSQVASFISRHRRTLVEFSFEDITLRSGDWDHALEPLQKMSSRRDGKGRLKTRVDTPALPHESMDVPCVLSPLEVAAEPRIMGLLEPQDEGNGGRGLGVGKWLNKRKSNKKQGKREWSGTDHLRKVLRSSVFTWR
jgi:hypothetical protein